jgi:hypothetical protein
MGPALWLFSLFAQFLPVKQMPTRTILHKYVHITFDHLISQHGLQVIGCSETRGNVSRAWLSWLRLFNFPQGDS